MRIVLSKKGFDDEFGKKPSIVLPNLRMVSFPIPVSGQQGVQTADVRIDGTRLDYYFSQLGISYDQIHHLDPVIQDYGQDYDYGAFGQSDKAASHPVSQGVSVGDVFLFCGTFFLCNQTTGKLAYEPMFPFHCIWGYLIVDAIVDVNMITENYYAGLRSHPHFQNKDLKGYSNNNVIYVGKEFGSFTFNENLRLTKNGYKKTYWSLPKCFVGVRPSWNGDNRFQDRSGRAEMSVFSKGQEFVIEANSAIAEWTRELIASS